MRRSHFHFALVLAILALGFRADAAPAGPLIKHISSLLKWSTRAASKTSQQDVNVLQFEDGYLTETVVEGNEIGVVPYRIRVSGDGELFAVDEVNSNIVKITPPLSQYSRGRLVAGSFQGYTGHVDGKPSEARFNHPKGVTMDDKGNVYVADTMNLAIRKIGDMGVTTIAGGKSTVPGYRDGPSEDAKFSNDFDVFYVHSTCSLLVIDRGNAALRQISLNQEDCDYQSSSISLSDVLMVVGAIFSGYALCLLQQGFGTSFFSKMKYSSDSQFQGQLNKQKPTPITESMEEHKWPSFGQLFADLPKLAVEALGSVLLYFIPSWFRSNGAKKGGLTPLKDSLRMPEDDVAPPLIKKQNATPITETRQLNPPNISERYSETKSQKLRTTTLKDPSLSSKKGGLTPLKDSLRMPEDDVEPPLIKKQNATPITETRQLNPPNISERYSETKPQKLRTTTLKDPSLSSKHRSSKWQEYAGFYGAEEVNSYARSKSHKEKTRHRQRDKTGEAAFSSTRPDPKPAEMKPVDHDTAKFDHYGVRSKYESDDSYRYRGGRP